MLSITSSNTSHLTVNNSSKTKYDMFIDDEEHRSSCESGNYNEEFSSTRNLIKTAYLDNEENDEQQFTRDQLDSFILNPNRQLNTSEPEYFISNRDSRVNYENDIDDEFRSSQNESSESSTSSSYEPDDDEDLNDEADSSENSDYEYSDSDERSTDDSLTSSDEELNEMQESASTVQLIKPKKHPHTTNDSQFVGHYEGSKPLLLEDEQEEYEDERRKEVTTGKLIEIDDGDENLFKNDSINYSLSSDLLNQSNQSNLSNLSNQSQEDELDKEVASNLFKQVEQDKLRNKDLFGSKPFNQETREALKVKLNLGDKLVVTQQQPPVNIFSDNQFNKMNIDQIKQQQQQQAALNSQTATQQLVINQVGDSSTLSLIASTLAESQGKLKKEDKYQSVKLPNVIKKQQKSQIKQSNEQPSQASTETVISNPIPYDEMPSPSTLFGTESEASNLKVIKSTKSSKLPSSLRNKDEKHLKSTKVKLHKSKLNPSKLKKSSQKNYKGIDDYDDDVDELLSNDQDDLSQALNCNKKQSASKSDKTEKDKSKKKSKESRLGLSSIRSSKDKLKEKDKELKKEKKHKVDKEKKEKLKEEKRLKKENKKLNKNAKERGFANMSFEDNIEDKEIEETRC